YQATGVTSTATSVTMSQLPVSPADTTNGGNFFPTSLGLLEGIDIDKATQTLYFTSQPVSSGTNGGIFSYALTSNTAGAYTTVCVEAAPADSSSSSGVPDGGLFYIAVDDRTGVYYVVDHSAFNGITPSQDDRVYVGSLSGGNPSAFL